MKKLTTYTRLTIALLLALSLTTSTGYGAAAAEPAKEFIPVGFENHYANCFMSGAIQALLAPVRLQPIWDAVFAKVCARNGGKEPNPTTIANPADAFFPSATLERFVVIRKTLLTISDQASCKLFADSTGTDFYHQMMADYYSDQRIGQFQDSAQLFNGMLGNTLPNYDLADTKFNQHVVKTLGNRIRDEGWCKKCNYHYTAPTEEVAQVLTLKIPTPAASTSTVSIEDCIAVFQAPEEIPLTYTKAHSSKNPDGSPVETMNTGYTCPICKEDVAITTKKTILTFAPVVVCYLPRLGNPDLPNTTPVTTPEIITLASKRYRLTSLVLWHTGHYAAIVRSNLIGDDHGTRTYMPTKKFYETNDATVTPRAIDPFVTAGDGYGFKATAAIYEQINDGAGAGETKGAAGAGAATGAAAITPSGDSGSDDGTIATTPPDSWRWRKYAGVLLSFLKSYVVDPEAENTAATQRAIAMSLGNDASTAQEELAAKDLAAQRAAQEAARAAKIATEAEVSNQAEAAAEAARKAKGAQDAAATATPQADPNASTGNANHNARFRAAANAIMATIVLTDAHKIVLQGIYDIAIASPTTSTAVDRAKRLNDLQNPKWLALPEDVRKKLLTSNNNEDVIAFLKVQLEK